MSAIMTCNQTKLETFLEQTACESRKPLRLHEFVLKALQFGFRGEERGELTKNVHRSLKRMVRKGVLHKDDDCAAEFVA